MPLTLSLSLSWVRRVAALTVAALMIAALAGCSTTPDSGNTEPSNSSDASFPVTVDTVRGKVTVNKRPERIVVLYSVYLELLDLIDVAPTAWTTFGMTTEEVQENSPWLEDGFFDKFPDPDPGLVKADFSPNVEAIAATKPDLILTNMWVDKPIYEQLSQIAPTYGGYGEDGLTWSDYLRVLNSLTGADAAVAVDKLEADLDADFAAVRKRLPGLQGATYQVPALGPDKGQFWLASWANPTLLEMGLVPGERQPMKAEESIVSAENIEQLNADVVFLMNSLPDEEAPARLKALNADPRLAGLPAKKNGTWVEVPRVPWLGIYNGGTPGSNRYFLDQVVPQLEKSALNQK